MVNYSQKKIKQITEATNHSLHWNQTKLFLLAKRIYYPCEEKALPSRRE